MDFVNTKYEVIGTRYILLLLKEKTIAKFIFIELFIFWSI